MEYMLIEGLYLMLVGMGFVLAFLSLVVLALHILARFAPPAPVLVTQAGPSMTSSSHHTEIETDNKKLAAISAAIHNYRNKNKN
jgi:oxaloacetate decarboxylase gamma subunit